MKQRYAEIQICKESAGWRLVRYAGDFLELTGYTRQQIEAQYHNNFMQMLSGVDISAIEELFLFPEGENSICPWNFTLRCAGQKQGIPVLCQLIADGHEQGLHIRVHDASFLSVQATKMEKRIALLEEAFPSSLCQGLMDEHFTIVWHNAHFLQLLGYTQEQFEKELHGRGTGYIYPPDQYEATRLVREAVARGDRVLTMDVRVVRRDGAVRTLLTSLSFTEETINDIPVLYCIGMDVTEQKQAHKLEIDAERLRIAMDQASSYIFEYDVQAHTMLASVGIQKYFGLEGDVTGVPEGLMAGGAVDPGSADRLRRLFTRIEQGVERAEEVVCLHAEESGNTDVWFRLRLTSVFYEEDRPVKAVLLAEDVTEHYQIEMRYHEEEKRRAAMTYDMVFSCQFNLTTEKILSADESKFPFFDFSKSDSSREMIYSNAVNYVYPDDRSAYLKRFSTAYMLEEFNRGVPEITLDFRGKDLADGSYHWRRGMAHIIREPSRGEIVAYFYTKDIDEEKKNELELRRHAEQDDLTGLYNRYTVELLCDKLLAKQRDGLSVMYMLDLDNFKYLNDAYGHLRGDDMLRQAADALRGIFHGEALLGRLGGDELVVFQRDRPSRGAAEESAQRICEDLRALEAGAGVVTVSVGIAFAPQHGEQFAQLYHCSDHALYQAKHAGKNRWAVYEKQEASETADKDRLPVSREWLLEESSDIVYVSDFYQYDLLYMNRGARKMFGIEDDGYLGRKCYEVLQKKDHPCEFCTNHLLCREKFYAWEFRNRSVGKSLLLRDRIVDWYGVPARIEFATDVSAIDQRNRDLEEQVEIDHVIISCLRELNGSKGFDEATAPMLRQLTDFYGADRAFIIDYDAERGTLLPHYEWRKEKETRTIGQLVGEEGVHPNTRLAKCLRTHENFFFDRSEALTPATPPYEHVLYDAGVSCQRGVPFYLGGQPAGMIGVDNPTAFRDEMTVLETLSYFISEELSRRKLSEKLAFLSYHDSLTGLWNRNRYIQYLEELGGRSVATLGIAVADLNALKDINKMRGHMQGDSVVKRAAALLRQSFPEAQIFRLSGDEFVIHTENLDRLTFLDQVKQVCAQENSLQGHGISVGYAWTDQDIDSNKLTMQATDIMLMNKREYYRYETQERASGKHDHASQQELMDCLRAGMFKMYLQPKADCAGFRLNGAEALVRFESPEMGLIPPDRFIPTLEQDHLIQYVDLFIFEEVCKLLAKWRADGQPMHTVSLNFSRQTALEPDLLKTLLSLTKKYGVPENCIEVEITESLGNYESTTIAEIGAGIKSAGFRLALDDFGSHYTNMAMLSVVPADVLKLDRGLVRDVMGSKPNQLVLKSILSLCRELGISSIAEGVETQEQLGLLRSLSCDSIQGYLFGRPTTVAEFERLYLNPPAGQE